MVDSFRIGAAEIVQLYDTTLTAPAANIFTTVDASAWQAYPDVSGDGLLRLTISAWLVRIDGRTVLVDLGIGPQGAPDFGIPPGRMLDSLAAVGVRPEEVDLIAITHLHLDHTGWAVSERDGRRAPTFPRARYLLQRREYEWASDPQVQAAATSSNIEQVINPVAEAGQLDLVDSEHTISPGMTFLSTPGHTPAHASIAISSGGERGLIIGDVSHHPAQIEHPDWSPAFDLDPERAAQTRKRIFEQLEEHETSFGAGHYPQPSYGRIVTHNGRRSWRPAVSP